VFELADDEMPTNAPMAGVFRQGAEFVQQLAN
jgi:hypothetical protein